jgi:hypothetical protein
LKEDVGILVKGFWILVEGGFMILIEGGFGIFG